MAHAAVPVCAQSASTHQEFEMIKKFALAAMTLAALNAHALTAGDIAFNSFNADEDGFSIVALSSIAANTTIYFGDNEYTGGAFNTGESYSKWVSGASVGTFTRETVSGSTNWGLAAANETLYAYQGGSATAPTSFLAAITNGDFAVDGPLTGTGLVEGVTAIRLNANTPSATPDYGVYNGVRSGLSSFAAYLPLLNNASNWTVDTTNGVYATTVPNTTAFTTAVPEPESFALALLSLGVIGAVARRRSAR
jgi:hypothetical protein